MSERDPERRGDRRRPYPAADGIAHVRIRPGHAATLIDVSGGGALIETSRRLLPNACAEVYMETRFRRASVRGRVLRCAVVDIRPTSLRYRAAIQFDSYLPWFVDEDEYDVRGGDVTGRVMRAETTPQVG